ncbi:hypothetical protein ACFQY3_16960 [Paenibacillus farraposensis]|uniref:hypothetical protein n=1 Tax=Paenibacillus TaxID=44249 RepID=UPI0004B1B880|nr:MULTISPECIES: hypothetical protein [Paenibacillus]MCC3379181.1 hypothetical protein [Paenibacillus farraposensis]MCC3379629.1 hypothetical protein [Paenibacillus farraposensis]MCC3381047.1 hypothetical protein [Paenibacillus farraposensis]MCC3381071.1 hypothetical protein [Paenibacillus farraposensis]
MIKTRVKTFKHRVGKNKFLVVKIFQAANARTRNGNALATNALNIKISKRKKHH